MLRIRTGRQLALMWAIVAIVFVVSALISIALAPTEPVTAPPASYYAGLVGLLAVGAALVPTWIWAGRTEAAAVGLMVQAAVIVAAILWLLAMIFPFL